MAENWASSPGPKPGNDRAVKLQKSIAMGVAAPASKRKVEAPGMKGGGYPCAHAPGLSYRK